MKCRNCKETALYRHTLTLETGVKMDMIQCRICSDIYASRVVRVDPIRRTEKQSFKSVTRTCSVCKDKELSPTNKSGVCRHCKHPPKEEKVCSVCGVKIWHLSKTGRCIRHASELKKKVKRYCPCGKELSRNSKGPLCAGCSADKARKKYNKKTVDSPLVYDNI